MQFEGGPLEGPVEVQELLRKGLEAKPDGPALVSLNGNWSWRALDEASGRLAANLLGLGLKPGDRVASLMPNLVHLIVHYIACLRAGLVTTPLNYRYTAPEIDHALEVSGASILLFHTEREADIAQSALASKLPLGRITFGGEAAAAHDFEKLLTDKPARTELPSMEPSAPAIIFFTSGSTGAPKGVTHSFETLGWMLACYREVFAFTDKDVFLTGSSLSHGGGYKQSLAALACGARVDVAEGRIGAQIVSLLRETRPTKMAFLPSALFALVRDHGARREDFASVRGCLCGGDKVAGELEKEFAELTGLEIREGYGMTENGCASSNPMFGLNKPGSVGLTSPSFIISLRDDSFEEVPAGEEGRLWFKSPCTTIGYWENPAATKAAIRDGWFDSGDVLWADQDHYLWFYGRKKQIIVHDGSNISPLEVEEALLEHPAVEAAGVVGIHNLLHGENVRAYVSLRPGAKRPSDQELIAFARARVGYKAPEEIVVLDELPLNPTGKIDRAALKRMAADASGAVIAP